MAIRSRKSSPVLLNLVIFILITTPPPSCSFSIPETASYYLVSVPDSLLTTIARSRFTRGDYDGSRRAMYIAHKISKLGQGYSYYQLMLSFGRDYLWNYGWQDYKMAGVEMRGVVSDMKELMRGLNELITMKSSEEREEWLKWNYDSMLQVSKSLFNRLFNVFSKSGALRDAVEMVRKEVIDGELLRDCLQLGGSDLYGISRLILYDFDLDYDSTVGKIEL